MLLLFVWLILMVLGGNFFVNLFGCRIFIIDVVRFFVLVLLWVFVGGGVVVGGW